MHLHLYLNNTLLMETLITKILLKKFVFFFNYFLIISVPHFGHVLLKQGFPRVCLTLCPQLGHMQLPAGPAPALLPAFLLNHSIFSTFDIEYQTQY